MYTCNLLRKLHIYQVFLLTEHSHQDFVDPRKDSDDVERRKRNVKEETHSDLKSLLIANVPEMNKRLHTHTTATDSID